MQLPNLDPTHIPVDKICNKMFEKQIKNLRNFTWTQPGHDSQKETVSVYGQETRALQ